MSSYLKSKYNYKTYELYLLISFIPLIIFAIYKYGYLSYQKNFLTFFEVFRVGYFFIISYILLTILRLLFRDKSNYSYFELGILIFLLPIRTSYFICILMVFLYFILKKVFKKSRINIVVLTHLFIILLLHYLGEYNYFSIYQENILTSYTTMDMFFGNTVNAIGASSSFLLGLCYIYLWNNKVYKKNIFLYCLLGFFLGLFLLGFLEKNWIFLIKSSLNSTVYFTYLFVSSLNKYSPISNKGQFWYGLLIGIGSLCLLTNFPYMGSLLSTMGANLFVVFFFKVKFLKK